MTAQIQDSLPLGVLGEDSEYLKEQLITYIGNKRSLLDPIERAIQQVCLRTGKPKLRMLDGFSGSGVVARLMKRYASELVVNDLENYSRIVNECYLANHSEIDLIELKHLVDELNSNVDTVDLPPGFIQRMYAPTDSDSIQPGERAFYTTQNARRLDNYRRLIAEAPNEFSTYLLGPLLAEASVHTNTAGVFKGFYKDAATGIGKFGGTAGNALERIMSPITMRPPVLSNYETNSEVLQLDCNDLVRNVFDFDLAYFDPPYNQHPYGSNYFMLNLVASYEEPTETSRVSGIPTDWRRSAFNARGRAAASLEDVLRTVDARFILLSYNSEGFVPPETLRGILADIGTVEEVELQYNTYRGSRNLGNRDMYVTEHLFLVERTH